MDDYPDFDACKAGTASSVQCPPYASATCFNVEAISIDLKILNPVLSYSLSLTNKRSYDPCFTIRSLE